VDLLPKQVGHRYPTLRYPQRDSDPRAWIESPVSWPLDDGGVWSRRAESNRDLLSTKQVLDQMSYGDALLQE
jgi:hypothetical protein